MKFSKKICLMIILKVTKNQGFTLSLEDTFFEKPQGGGGQFDPPAVSGLKIKTAKTPSLRKRTSNVFLISCRYRGIDLYQSEAASASDN